MSEGHTDSGLRGSHLQEDDSVVPTSNVETPDLEITSESTSSDNNAALEDYTEDPEPSVHDDDANEAPDDDVPDPFLIDDSDESDSQADDKSEDKSQILNPSEDDVVPEDEIALAQSTANLTTPTSALLLNKPTPPTPQASPRPARFPSTVEEESSSSSEDDDSPLDLYLSSLVLPTMFLPLPNVRISLLPLKVLYND